MRTERILWDFVPGTQFTRERYSGMTKTWTTEDLKTLRSELMFQRDMREVAAALQRPVDEVQEMARDLGWINGPPLVPN